MQIRRVCVYCASSTRCDSLYHAEAFELGRILARLGVTVVFGGAADGSMGSLANGALSEAGRVIGVMPRFLAEFEPAHPGLSELVYTDDLHQRKKVMIAEVDAVIALPGGCGTFEELFEALSWKRLGLYNGPVIIVNTRNFFGPCIQFLERSIDERFMDEHHRAMWTVVDNPTQVPHAIQDSEVWSGRAARLREVNQLSMVQLRSSPNPRLLPLGQGK